MSAAPDWDDLGDSQVARLARIHIRSATAEIERLQTALAQREGNDAWWREQRDIWNEALATAERERDNALARAQHAETDQQVMADRLEQAERERDALLAVIRIIRRLVRESQTLKDCAEDVLIDILWSRVFGPRVEEG